MFTPTQIIIHHSATADNAATLSWDDIRDYHINNNGWKDIGYHLGIEKVEGKLQVLIGRPWDEPGAHAPGANHNSIGVCIVGNFELAPPAPDVWEKAVKTVASFCNLLKIEPENVKGHKEVTAGRTCPGKYFDLYQFRKDVRGRM